MVDARTTVGVFKSQADKYGERPLVHRRDAGGGWIPFTWKQMRDAAFRVAAALLSEGVQPGEAVIILSENRLEWIYSDLGIQAAGAVTVPIYPSTPGPVAQTIAANCGAQVALVSSEKQAAKLSALRKVVVFGDSFESWLGETSPQSVAAVDERMAGIKPEDLCTIIYTSGTTGDPKGVELTHGAFIEIAHAILKVFPLSEDDVTLSFLPLSHVFERVCGMFTGFFTGGQTYMSQGLDHLAEDLAEVRPTLMLGVPRMFEKIHALVLSRVRDASGLRRAMFRWALKAGPGNPLARRLVLDPLKTRLTGGRLRFFVSGGAALSQEIEQFFWSIGVPILNGWGMTETCAATASNTLEHHKFRTVGRPFPGIELKIAEDGEILVKSPGNMVGYHRNPSATAEVLKDGWLYTGDIGEIDADGYLKITDRKKELIKTAGGKYIAPQPIEFELQHDPLVERAVVIGEGRPYVTALIIPNWDEVHRHVKGEPATLARSSDVLALFQPGLDKVNSSLGSWETVKYFTLLDRDFTEENGELTPSLKMKRRVIAQHYADDIEAMYTGKSRPSSSEH